jgi:hypothetical protein
MFRFQNVSRPAQSKVRQNGVFGWLINSLFIFRLHCGVLKLTSCFLPKKPEKILSLLRKYKRTNDKYNKGYDQ